MEDWRIITGFERYMISSQGRLKMIESVRGERIVPTYLNRKGYVTTALYKPKDKKAYSYSVHRLVVLTFLGNPPSERHTVNHKNRIKTDNRVENLEWATPEEQGLNRDYPLGELGYRHIYNYHKGKKPFMVQIRRSHKIYTVGRYETLDEAIFFRDAFLDMGAI